MICVVVESRIEVAVYYNLYIYPILAEKQDGDTWGIIVVVSLIVQLQQNNKLIITPHLSDVMGVIVLTLSVCLSIIHLQV